MARAESSIAFVRKGQRVTVEMRTTGDVLAYCYIGDDENVERIADILSAKRLPRDAMKLRQMAMDDRKRVTIAHREKPNDHRSGQHCIDQRADADWSRTDYLAADPSVRISIGERFARRCNAIESRGACGAPGGQCRGQ